MQYSQNIFGQYLHLCINLYFCYDKILYFLRLNLYFLEKYAISDLYEN